MVSWLTDCLSSSQLLVIRNFEAAWNSAFKLNGLAIATNFPKS